MKAHRIKEFNKGGYLDKGGYPTKVGIRRRWVSSEGGHPRDSINDHCLHKSKVRDEHFFLHPSFRHEPFPTFDGLPLTHYSLKAYDWGPMIQRVKPSERLIVYVMLMSLLLLK